MRADSLNLNADLLLWLSYVREVTKSASSEARQVLRGLASQIPSFPPELFEVQVELAHRLSQSLERPEQYDPDLHRFAVDLLSRIQGDKEAATPPRVSPCARRKLFTEEGEGTLSLR